MAIVILIFILLVLAIGIFSLVGTSNNDKKTNVVDMYGRTTNKYDLKREYNKQGIAYCPSCMSTNVQFMESRQYGQRDPKTKTTYKANLNPLKPFTLVDSKTKVVKKGSAGYTVQNWHCLNCGKVYKK